MGRAAIVVALAALVPGALAGCRTHLDATLPHAVPLDVSGSGSDELGEAPAGATLPDELPAPPPLEGEAPARPPAHAAPQPPPPPPPSEAVAPPALPSLVPVEPPGVSPATPTFYPSRRPRPCATVNIDPLACPDPCRAYRNAWWGVSGSFLPNVGLALEVGGVFERHRCLVWSWEGELTWQFLDDETFADDDRPAAGDWWQVQVGVKAATNPHGRRHWTGRAGLAWFYAGEEPNIVEAKGHYFGIYGGIGFETDLDDALTTGPEVSAMLVMHEDGLVEVVPQINWHFIWNF